MGIWMEPLYALVALRRKVRAVHVGTCSDSASVAAVFGSCVLSGIALPAAHVNDHAGYRLDLAQGVACCLGAREKRTFGALQAMIGHRAWNVNAVALTLIDSHYGIDSRFARSWSIRGMALWVLVLLLGYLMLYYI